MQKIELVGFNGDFRISEKPSQKNKEGKKFIYPPVMSDLGVTCVLSYSTYYNTIIVTKDGLAHGIGDNRKKQISGSIPVKIHSHFIDIELKDTNGTKVICKTVTSGNNYTLYMISKSFSSDKNQLAYSHQDLECDFPIILKFEREFNPVSLFCGCYDCAAIGSDGSIAYIHYSFYESPSNTIAPVFLPDNEKAISVAWNLESMIVLSLNCRVFESKRGTNISFTEINELKGKEIISISGVYGHCFALNKNGEVFVCGRNKYGQLGLGTGTSKASQFTKVSLLNRYKICAVYAGHDHSLFQTQEGKLFACGSNDFGQLLIPSGPGPNVYEPTETTVKNASFCIAGRCTTIVFKNYVPPMNSFKTKFDERETSDENSFLKKKIADLEKQLNSKDQQIEKERKQKKELEKKLLNKDIEMINERSELQNEIENLNAQIRVLKINEENSLDRFSILEKTNKALKDLLKKQEDEMEEGKVGLAQKINHIEELEKHNQEMCIKNKKLMEDLNNINEENDKNKMVIESLEKEKIELKRIVKEAKDDNDEDKKEKHVSHIQIFDSKTIDSFEKIEEISYGNSGKVFKVAKKSFYALKEMKTKVSHEELKQFIQEYDFLCILNHPNIVKAFGILLSDKKRPPSILLEFCQMNLEEAIQKKFFSNIDIIFVICQIVEGMKYVHFKNVIHRDLKPTNILIANDGTIKISDFGISKLMSTDVQSMTGGVGTQRFMAPEIIDECENYNEKVDVYSFGVLIFYILSGGEMPKIKMSEILSGKKAELPKEFNKISSKLINDCWNFDPKDRPSFVEIDNYVEKNKFKLINLTDAEIKEVALKIKSYKEKIPLNT